MKYEEYARCLKEKPIFHVDWKCPKCGASIDYEPEYADGPSSVYMPSGNIIMTDVLRCDDCGIDVTARQVFIPQDLVIDVEED